MEDVHDFWKWFNTDLAPYVASKAPGIDLNFERLLVSGDSAGGLLALQSAITVPERKIKAVLCQYPMTDYLNRKPEVFVNGKPAPGPEIIDSFLEQVPKGTVISSSIPPARMELSYALSAYGRWLEYYGAEKKLLPIFSVEDAVDLPPTLIIHGEQDEVVDVEDSRKFVEKVDDVMGNEVRKNVRLVTADGGHGFDTAAELTEEDADWLKEGLEWLEGKWLV
jgi:acetyl esterase/lipase